LIGKLKRSPFDIPKAKSEIVAGPLTEFSGRKLALWHLAIHVQTVVGVFLLTDVFLGGGGIGIGIELGFLSVLVFGAKALLILLALSIAGALYTRLRIDQLVSLGWRVLAPLALAQMLVTIWMGA
jgi:NADH-quinone oxidoreductase subunit H